MNYACERDELREVWVVTAPGATPEKIVLQTLICMVGGK